MSTAVATQATAKCSDPRCVLRAFVIRDMSTSCVNRTSSTPARPVHRRRGAHFAEGDGVVRSLPLIAEFKGQYYESLSLAMFRMLAGSPTVVPGFPRERFLSRNYQGLESIQLKLGAQVLAIPVDERVSSLMPFRGYGGPRGGSFRYVSAA